METKEPSINKNREIIDLGFKPTKRNLTSGPNWILIGGGILVVVIIAILGVYFLHWGKPAGKNQTSSAAKNTQVSTKSAVAKTDYCKGSGEFDNNKQGYKVCLPSNWSEKDLKVSQLTSGFSPSGWSDAANAKITIAVSDTPVDVSLQNAQNDSSKFAFGKQDVGGVKGTQITYTRQSSDPLAAAYPEVIETYVAKFGRTFTITLNSNSSSFTIDQTLYNSFIDSWEFIAGTANPPWSESDNILVNSPWPGDSVSSPVEVSGEAIAFEGTVNIRIKDSAGHTLVDTTVQTQSGNERSPFDSKVTFNNPSTKKGTLEVFTISAKDGSEQDKVTVALNFQ